MLSEKLQNRRQEIVAFLDLLQTRVFKRSEMETVLSEQRAAWKLPKSTTTSRFLAYLIETQDIVEYRLKFPARTETRFVRQHATDLEVLQTLRTRGYFSHFTAMVLHGLTDETPKNAYLNCEQPPKEWQLEDRTLAQERIDYAFGAACRVSNTVAKFRGLKVYILNGKHTGELGVIQMNGEHGNPLRVTGVERTLIDIAVRPVYSGGVPCVLEAYKRAATLVSTKQLMTLLKDIDYIYPFHQAIGFYMEKAGTYSEQQLDCMRRLPMEFDFYLTHRMRRPQYSKEWRLYYPKGL